MLSVRPFMSLSLVGVVWLRCLSDFLVSSALFCGAVTLYSLNIFFGYWMYGMVVRLRSIMAAVRPS